MSLRIDLKIFAFLILFYITKQIEIYGIIMFFCIIHELAHLFAGLFMGLFPNKIEIMPFGFSISFKLKPKDYNLKIKNASVLEIKKIIIAIAGPAINIMLAFVLYYVNVPFVDKWIVIYSNILIGLFNLIPIYPLDGARIIDGILYILLGRKKSIDYTNFITNITFIVFTMLCSIGILYIKNISLFLINIYLLCLVIKENKKYKIRKRVFNICQK